jgi:hypothetical protein
MAPLLQLFALEVEFHRRVRSQALGAADTAALHTSYALQSGYEPLLRRIGRVTVRDIERLAERFAPADLPLEVLAARDSVIRLLGITTEVVS